MPRRFLVNLLFVFILTIGYFKSACFQNNPVLAASNENSPYGMNTALFWHNNQIFPENKWETAIDKMAQAGVKFNRTSIVWALIQPIQGDWNWEKHDRLIDLLTSRGISPLGYFFFYSQVGLEIS